MPADSVLLVSHRITGAVLTWRSPLTLQRSLLSYRQRGLDRLLHQRLVLVQEGGGEEAEIARSFGWEAIVEDTNIGIGPAYARLVDRACGELFMFLECDWVLIEDPRRQVAASADLIMLGTAEVVRLRSTRRPGFPLGMLRYQNREHLHPEWLIESVFYDPQPWRSFHGIIERVVQGGVEFALARPAHASWSNNPHLVGTNFVRQLLAEGGGDLGNLECSAIADQWGETDAHVAHAPGLFTHRRVDGTAINTRDLRYHAEARFRWWTRKLRHRTRR